MARMRSVDRPLRGEAIIIGVGVLDGFAIGSCARGASRSQSAAEKKDDGKAYKASGVTH